MKTMLFGLLILCASFAKAECTQLEAQVIAHVQNVIAEDATTCTVSLEFSAPNSMLNPSYVCPLTWGEVSTGVTLPKNNGTCPVQSGSFLSGILYKSANGADSRVYLE